MTTADATAIYEQIDDSLLKLRIAQHQADPESQLRHYIDLAVRAAEVAHSLACKVCIAHGEVRR